MTKKGVYFAFRDQGACISVLAVKVYYITCPAVTENFAHFNETPTGREVTIIEQQTGVCVENAEAVEAPTYLCKGDGKWTILTGGCRCKVGFEPDADKQTCTICAAGMFRSAEVSKCTPCPPHSGSTAAGSAFCACKEGHYRHPKDGRHMPCYRPPGPPSNLTLLFMDQTSAILSWTQPQPPSALTAAAAAAAATSDEHQRYRNDIVFRVRCAACSANVVLNPSSDTFNDTKLTLTNLEQVTTYTVQIHSLNGVSYLRNALGNDSDDNVSAVSSGSAGSSSANGGAPNDETVNAAAIKTEYAELTFTTESAIQSAVFNVRILTVTSKEVDLVWDRPVHLDSPIDFYEVRWFPKSDLLDGANKTTVSTKEAKAHVDSLMENTEYGFQVRCKTLNGWGSYSNIVYGQTLQSVSPGRQQMILLNYKMHFD